MKRFDKSRLTIPRNAATPAVLNALGLVVAQEMKLQTMVATVASAVAQEVKMQAIITQVAVAEQKSVTNVARLDTAVTKFGNILDSFVIEQVRHQQEKNAFVAERERHRQEMVEIRREVADIRRHLNTSISPKRHTEQQLSETPRKKQKKKM